MTWLVQYRDDATDRLVRYPSPEQAIEAACHLLDDGCDVYSMSMGSLDHSITKAEIARIYAIWVKERFPFGKISIRNTGEVSRTISRQQREPRRALNEIPMSRTFARP